MTNSILQKYHNGKASIGTFINSGSWVSAEAVGIAGMDYFIVDIEHSPFGISEVTTCIRAAESKGITPFVRICDINRDLILRVLDAGTMGIIIPGIRKKEEVEKIISLAKYTPLGERGFCPTRVCNFGYGDVMKNGIQDYTALCNRETMVIPQCETMEALNIIEDLVSMDGVDGIFVGPFDLSLNMGKPAQFNDEEVKRAFVRIQEACKQARKPSFIFAPDIAKAQEHIGNGFNSVTVNADVNFLIETYKNVYTQLQ